jgi:nicotinamide riboside kinase
MRIYYVGAHSTGKSTLARYTSKKYNLPFISELARSVLSEKEIPLETLRVDLDLIDNYQQEVFQRQFAEEQKYNNGFVSDRSFDNLAYMAQHARLLSKVMKDPSLEEYINSLRHKDVTIFFVRPSRITMRNDGVRESVNWDGIVSIDANVKFMLEMWNLKYIQINTDSMQERVRLVDSVLDRQ